MARGVFLVKADCVLAGLDVAFEAFRQVDAGPCAALAPQAGRRRLPRRRRDRARSSAPRARCSSASGPRSIFCSGCRASPPGRAGSSTRPAAASPSSTRARRRRRCARWRSTPSRAGGATNHRVGLFDAILIKDNHIRLAGGVQAAVERARAHGPACRSRSRRETLEQVDEALAAGADTILVDNMSTDEIREAVSRARGRAKIEISGGVTLERIPELAATGADFVSVGALTHSAPAIDISFEIEPA